MISPCLYSASQQSTTLHRPSCTHLRTSLCPSHLFPRTCVLVCLYISICVFVFAPYLNIFHYHFSCRYTDTIGTNNINIIVRTGSRQKKTHIRYWNRNWLYSWYSNESLYETRWTVGWLFLQQDREKGSRRKIVSNSLVPSSSHPMIGNLELVRTCCCQEHFNVFACDQQHICKTKLNIEYESIIILFPSRHSLIKKLVNNYDDHHTITIYGDIPPSPCTLMYLHHHIW